ncbi:hypothetical protein BSU04_36890 [Caballeronia sordidicola]|uniref:Uncharacterized protein n=1 Tax=Caballeronia sordidicola TaxID=196367 RepID=A0A226WRN8_CABSO|nr:hypothetical protein BSU04_36890 [Caballeronia sordidicola]
MAVFATKCRLPLQQQPRAPTGERAGPERKTQSLEDRLVRHRQRLERRSGGHTRGSSDE